MINEFINLLSDRIRGAGKQKFPVGTVDAGIINDYNKTRQTGVKGSFCNAPGINMLFGQDGKIRACCHNRVFVLGEYPKQSISEIWKSDAYKELRAHVKNVDLSHGCEICQADMNTRSFEEVRAKHFDSLPRHADYPTMMEFMMSNTCNLECVMCYGENSSLIRKNREKLPPIISPYDKAFLTQLEEFIPYLSETRFSSSGEAFAIDINYEIWEMIIRLNPKCIIMVQTNATFLNARIKDLLDRGNFRIGISLDSLQKETYEAIRVNARFERVMDNVRYFSDYSRSNKEKFTLSLCVMRQNWRELPDFIKFCDANNAVATLHKVWLPLEHALHNLGYEELNEIYTYLYSFDWPVQSTIQKLNKRHYQYFVSTVKAWRDQAILLEEQGADLSLLNEVDLLAMLRLRLRKGLEPVSVTEEEAIEIITACTGKVMEILEDCETKKERVTILKLMCMVPPFKMLKSLRYSPIETLKPQIKAYWANDLANVK